MARANYGNWRKYDGLRAPDNSFAQMNAKAWLNFPPIGKRLFGDNRAAACQARTMALDRILLSDFRNHRATALDGAGKFNLLVGDNGAGKTNVLEALSLFAPGRGLRRANLAEIPASAGSGGLALHSAESVDCTPAIPPHADPNAHCFIDGSDGE